MGVSGYEGLVERAQEAAACGMWLVPASETERRQLCRRTARGEFVQPMRSMYATSGEWSDLKKRPKVKALRTIRTLASLHGDWVFCLFSAAVVYGLEVSYDDLEPLHVLTPRRCSTKSTRHIVRHPSGAIDGEVHDGARVTPPARTVVDCLLASDFKRSLALVDSALRVLRISKQELEEELDRRALPDDALASRVARAAIRHGNPRAENGGESVARAVMIEQGFMVPELQVVMADPLVPGKHFRLDFGWDLGDGRRVAGELDGKDKYVDEEMTGGRSAVEVLTAERRRESHVGAGGLQVMRFSYGEVLNEAFFVRLLELYGIPRGAAQSFT